MVANAELILYFVSYQMDDLRIHSYYNLYVYDNRIFAVIARDSRNDQVVSNKGKDTTIICTQDAHHSIKNKVLELASEQIYVGIGIDVSFEYHNWCNN